MPAGRRPDYRPEYCEMLIEHMRQGGSFESFAATAGVTRATLYNWEKKYPEFLDAKKIGEPQSEAFYEKIAIAAMVGKIKNFNAVVWIFTMKNRFGWRDRHEVSSADGTKNVPSVVLSEAEITRQLTEKAKRALSLAKIPAKVKT